MNTTLSMIALALAGTLAVHAQEPAPGDGKGERRGGGRQVPPQVLKEFDKDGDGKLNEEEGKAAREALQARRAEAEKKRLEKYDTDKDGKLNDDERKAMRADLEAKHKALVEKYDADKDGKLSPTEIKAARDAGEEIPEFRQGGGGRRGQGGQGGRGGEGGGEKPTPPAGE